MSVRRVLSLGQCAADGAGIARLLRDRFGAEVVAVDEPGEALAELRQGRFDLVLVNRQLEYDGPGLAFIGQVKSDAALGATPVMLVSNYADAQRQAVALGALPGFGKAALTDPLTLKRLGEVLGAGGPTA